MKVISLFSNIGISETFLEEIDFKVVLASEICKRRMQLYSDFYPKTDCKLGDFSDQHFFKKLVDESIKIQPEIILATPPCQGMSTAGQQVQFDPRNDLNVNLINYLKVINPKYIFIENVPLFLKTKILYKECPILIKDLLNFELKKKYHIEYKILNTKNYSVPQSRSRVIFLLTRKDIEKRWTFPKQDMKIITLNDAIGNLPKLDPWIKDVTETEQKYIFPQFYKRKIQASKISKWHKPPHHLKRQVLVMMKTPSGKSAFSNQIHKPIKENGETVKGYGNTYKRQDWNLPAFTITMDNVKISSQNNVHPGRFLEKNKIGEDVYSDARVLTFYELMKLTTLPDEWSVPTGSSEAFIRRVIGEGIPPLLVKKIFNSLNQ